MPTSPPARRGAPEIRALIGARGIPVLLIALFHYHEWLGYPHAGWYDTIVSKGYIWVEFFFALSGFVLFYAYGSRFGAGLELRAVAAFLAARISRLYPLHLATLLAVVIQEIDRRRDASRLEHVSFFDVPVFGGRTLGALVSNLFMVQSWGFHDNMLSWNSPAWFVSVEFFLCLVCPLLVLAMGPRLGWRSVTLGAASVVLLVTLARASGRGLDMTYRFSMGRGLADFGIGLALGALFVTVQGRSEAGRGRRSPGRHTIAQIVAVTAVVAAVALSGPARTPRDLLVAAPIFSLVFLLAFDRGLIARALHARWLIRLGEWSFGIYMVHYVVMSGVTTTRLPETPWLSCAVSLAASIALGGLAHRYVEQPVGAALRKRLSKALAR